VLSTGIRLSLPEAHGADGFQIREIFRLPKDTTISNITVTVEGQNLRFKTNKDGWFKLAGLSPGHYVVTSEIDGTTYSRTILIRGLDDSRSRWRYRDVVRDQAGQPLAGIEVTIEERDERTTTDKEGRFEFNLPAGRYTLLIWIDGWAQRRQITIREEDRKQLLTLRYGGLPLDPDETKG
jgi:hypothetical protein